MLYLQQGLQKFLGEEFWRSGFAEVLESLGDNLLSQGHAGFGSQKYLQGESAMGCDEYAHVADARVNYREVLHCKRQLFETVDDQQATATPVLAAQPNSLSWSLLAS
jgi:hypothetical protein